MNLYQEIYTLMKIQLWFDEELSNEKYGVFRGTGVLIKKDNNWLISQYNLLLM